MASGVAHDFNNLLATILGRVQLLKFKFRSYQGQEKRVSTKYLVEGLSIIEKAATAGAEVVRRVQEFTNVAADTQHLHEIHINDLIKDVIEYMKLHWKGEADARDFRMGSCPGGKTAELPDTDNINHRMGHSSR
jgi:signal transduction histidine kinase